MLARLRICLLVLLVSACHQNTKQELASLALPAARQKPNSRYLRTAIRREDFFARIGPEQRAYLSFYIYDNYKQQKITAHLVYEQGSQQLVLQGKRDSRGRYQLETPLYPRQSMEKISGEFTDSLTFMGTLLGKEPLSIKALRMNSGEQLQYQRKMRYENLKLMGRARSKQMIRIGIHPDLPEYKLVFEMEKHQEGTCSVKAFYVVETVSNELIQRILLHDSELIYSHHESEIFRQLRQLLEVRDYNFDGYMDLRFFIKKDHYSEYYSIWLFEPERKAFTEMGTFINPKIDPASQTFTAYTELGPTQWDYTQVTYQNIKDEFGPQQLKISSLLSEGVSVVTEKRFSEGEWVELGRKEIKIKE